MEWLQLEYFKVVVQLGHITRLPKSFALHSLHLTIPSEDLRKRSVFRCLTDTVEIFS